MPLFYNWYHCIIVLATVNTDKVFVLLTCLLSSKESYKYKYVGSFEGLKCFERIQ